VGNVAQRTLTLADIRIRSLGGKASMRKRSAAERKEFARKAGKAGGKARAKKLTKNQRSASAQKAARARWAKL
jgi:hypothetical protein